MLYEQNLVIGLPLIKNVDGVCESCPTGKQHRDSFPKENSRKARQLAKLIHVDAWGSMHTYSLNGNRYFIVFVDDFSRMT